MTVGPTTTAFAWIVGRVPLARRRRPGRSPVQRLVMLSLLSPEQRQGLAAIAAHYRAPVAAGPERLSGWPW